MNKGTVKSVIIVGLLYLGMEMAGITCPIKYITGISCAGCGMSRAWLALLSFDLKSAFFYHPLFWVVPLAVLVFMMRNRINEKTQNVLYWAICVLMLTVWVARMINPNDGIVVFEPEQGIIVKFLRSIKKSF